MAVMFHYVRPSGDPRYPGLHVRTPDQFRRQLDVLDEVANYVSPQHLESLINGEKEAVPIQRGFVLTFDDGLKDHIEYVAPELERRGWQGMFFVNTAPWHGELLDVHKLQLLNASIPFKQLFPRFLETARDHGSDIDFEAIPMERVRQFYRYDEDDVARFKFVFQFEIPPDIRVAVVRSLFAHFLGKDENHADNLYLSPEDCKRLSAMGHTIGCHSHRHRALSLMNPVALSEDLSTNIGEIAKTIGNSPEWLSFPYGITDAEDDHVVQTCKHLGIRYGFTVNRKLITETAYVMSLPRSDTNDAPGGANPFMTW